MGWFFGSSSDDKKSVDAKNEIKRQYGSCCALCENLDINNKMNGGWFSSDKFKCYKGWCTLTEKSSCVKEISADPNYGRDFTKVYEMITGRRYFVLTAIFEILGFNLENHMYEEISKMIQSVREDAATEVEAIEYDIVGMDIAICLRKDENRVELCNDLFETYITKIYSLLRLNKKNEAISLYKNMIVNLFIRYRDRENYSQIIDATRLNNKTLR